MTRAVIMSKNKMFMLIMSKVIPYMKIKALIFDHSTRSYLAIKRLKNPLGSIISGNRRKPEKQKKKKLESIKKKWKEESKSISNSKSKITKIIRKMTRLIRTWIIHSNSSKLTPWNHLAQTSTLLTKTVSKYKTKIFSKINEIRYLTFQKST